MTNPSGHVRDRVRLDFGAISVRDAGHHGTDVVLPRPQETVVDLDK
ncbi:hypothetical protein ACIBO2_39800 [Nonomuraea sp. NPDC050022]